jgi:pimeloyl-ACP methyl ester carboxylesterase/predicted glycosyltransferase
MRAAEPRETGYAQNSADGIQIYYEVFGRPDASRTIVFLPTWNIVHSRAWKMQVPYFAQQGFRVVTYDARGNGRSGRPATGYQAERLVEDAIAVFQSAGVDSATLVALSAGARLATVIAVEHPDLVEKIVFVGAAIRFLTTAREKAISAFTESPPDRQGWNKFNAVHWREDYLDFLEWFMSMTNNVPHSTKGVEDAIAWGQETTPEILIASNLEGNWPDMTILAKSIQCPTLILHGSRDLVNPVENAYRLRDTVPNSRLVVFDGSGHNPAGRDPVYANELIHDFLGRDLPQTTIWSRALSRPKRAIYVSSPIGLGHAQRDVAIANELRSLVPDLQIDWLSQPPVTGFLEMRGERIHPLSASLAGESAHLESEMTGEHELPAFQAMREMDEILLANFFVFLEAVRGTEYDLWIGDEAWDLDHFLLENPELKTAPYAWLTDFVGHLPADEDTVSERERYLMADYNAELVNQIDRYPSLRDVSLFIGNPDDILPVPLGPDLPLIPEWTAQTHDFTGYVRYFDPEVLDDRKSLRKQFGFRPDEQVAVAAVGGTAVGRSLLRRIIDAYPVAREFTSDLRLVVICGPRIDPTELPQIPGIEYQGYVHNLFEMLSAADVALVQGGLSTTMELVALQKPFLYFPLQQHSEQQRHVAYRLERYGVPSWARMQYSESSPETIAQRLVKALREPVCYQPVEAGGARRAAEKIAELIQHPASVTAPIASAQRT